MSRRVVAMALGLSTLLALALLGGAASSPAASKGGPLPAPSLRPSSAWLSVTTGSSNISNLAPAVWAITARSNLAALAPFNNFDNLRHLSRNAVYLWATTAGRGGPDATFKRAEWPLRLSRFRLDRGWEGQPRRTCSSDYAGPPFAGGISTFASISPPSIQADSSYGRRSKS